MINESIVEKRLGDMEGCLHALSEAYSQKKQSTLDVFISKQLEIVMEIADGNITFEGALYRLNIYAQEDPSKENFGWNFRP